MQTATIHRSQYSRAPNAALCRAIMSLNSKPNVQNARQYSNTRGPSTLRIDFVPPPPRLPNPTKRSPDTLRHSERRCFGCERPGHYARSCPDAFRTTSRPRARFASPESSKIHHRRTSEGFFFVLARQHLPTRLLHIGQDRATCQAGVISTTRRPRATHSPATA